MASNVVTCPKCNAGRLTTRTSARLGSRIERHRRCGNPSCDYRDVALIRPAEIISVRVLCTQQQGDPNRRDTV